jgi:hypothetical protein
MRKLEEMISWMVSGSRGSHFQDFYHGQGKLNSEHAYAPSFAGLNDKAISATASPFALLLT